MPDYTIADLEEWDKRIQAVIAEESLNTFPQEFELCDFNEMIGYEAYAGMPSHYPHWSFGKGFERKETLYNLGIVGLPYEMVINSNPALAYLMRDNTLLLQILTMTHVYAHNDFFKNNLNFSSTQPQYTIEKFKAHADRVRTYIEDPSIGAEKVEWILDAAHALQFQCQRAQKVKKLTIEDQKKRALERALPKEDPFHTIHKRKEYEPPDLNKLPLEPEKDVLIFIRDHNPYLEEWEKDLITIVVEEASYFLPQIETKIMNEGWASFWHYRILHKLNLDQGLHLEFLKCHNQVIRPLHGGLNPYHLGFKIFEDIYNKWETPTKEEQEEYHRPDGHGKEKIFQVRESDRDVSFLRQYLTEKLMRELDLFMHTKKGKDRVIAHISSEEGWKKVKENLLKNAGIGGMPVIRIVEVKTQNNQELILRHEYDGRELDIEYSDKTLKYVHRLWGRKVMLETQVGGDACRLAYEGKGEKSEISHQCLN
jgi:stage V sporulation protein R